MGKPSRRVLLRERRSPSAGIMQMANALGFVNSLLCDARRLAHGACFRRDPLLPEELGIRRVPSSSALSRFFAGFASSGRNLVRFR